MRRIIGTIMMFVAIIIIVNLNGYKADAGEHDELVHDIYNSFVVEGESEYIVNNDGDLYHTYEVQDILEEVFAIDDPQNPYDGIVLMLNGQYTLTRNDGVEPHIVTITRENVAADSELKRTVQLIAEEVTNNVGNKDSEFECTNYMSLLFANKFSHEENSTKSFTEAYGQKNNAINSSQYALAAYLVGKELDLNVIVLESTYLNKTLKSFSFNAIEIKGTYIAYDFSLGTRYAGITDMGKEKYDVSSGGVEWLREESENLINSDNFREYSLLDRIKSMVYFANKVPQDGITFISFIGLFIIFIILVALKAIEIHSLRKQVETRGGVFINIRSSKYDN